MRFALKPVKAAQMFGLTWLGMSGEVCKNVNPVAVLRPDAVAIFVVPYVVTKAQNVRDHYIAASPYFTATVTAWGR
jgi:hypothetical protein